MSKEYGTNISARGRQGFKEDYEKNVSGQINIR
jgi:hypothetical protein